MGLYSYEVLQYCKERRSSLSSSWLVINLPPLPTSLRLTPWPCCVMMRGLNMMMMVTVIMMVMVMIMVMMVMMVDVAGH